MSGLLLGDAPRTLLWLCANVALLLAVQNLSRRLFPSDTLRQHWIHVLLLFLACVVGLGVLLGVVGILSGWALVTSAVMLAASVLWSVRRDAWMRKGTHGWSTWAVCWCLPAGFALDAVIARGLLAFPTDWDSLMYHLPLFDQWLQTGALHTRDAAFWFVAGNHELLGLWIVAPFSGDYLIALLNLPAAILLVLTTTELARTLGVAGPLCHWTGLATASSAVVFIQLTNAGNDMMVAALFLAGLVCGFRYLSEGRAAEWVLAAMCLGLLAGVKYYALGYAGLAGVVLVGAVLLLHGFRKAVWAAFLGVVAFAVLGGYWYVRNLVMTGTPLYPMGFTAASDQLAHLRPDYWKSSFLGNENPELGRLAVRAIWNHTGPCHLAAFLILPVSVTWLVVTALYRGRPTEVTIRLAFVGLVVGSGLLTVATPFAVEDVPGTLNQLTLGYTPVRYGLCFLTLALVALVLVLQDMIGWLQAIAPRLALLVSACFAIVAIHQFTQWLRLRWLDGPILEYLLFALAVPLFVISLWICRSTWPDQWSRVVAGLGIAGMAGAVVAVGWLSQRWHEGFAAHYDQLYGTRVFRTLAETDTNSTRIVALWDCCYPLLGSDRRFRVHRPLVPPEYPDVLDYCHEQRAGILAVHSRQHPRMAFLLREDPRVRELSPPGAVLAVFRIDSQTDAVAKRQQ